MGVTEQGSGISRRDLIKKGAVAGGIVWTAPLILSDTAGATYVGSIEDCQHYYWCKYAADDTNDVITTRDGVPSHCYVIAPPNNTVGPGYVQGRTYQDGCASVIGVSGRTITLSKHLNNDTTEPVIEAVSGYTKSGSGAGSCAAAGVTQNADGTWTITFPLIGAGGFSHVEFAYCTA
jgi:hypothetical protein